MPIFKDAAQETLDGRLKSVVHEGKFEDGDLLAQVFSLMYLGSLAQNDAQRKCLQEDLPGTLPTDPFGHSASNVNEVASPFDEIVTRAPTTRPENWRIPESSKNQQQCCVADSAWWRIYPSLRPKDASYCSQMYRMFIYTCQPGKPLRIDLLQFCEEYSSFCGVPNTHRFPGAREVNQHSGGNIGVGGNFGFGIGVIPGLDVGVGWGVGVGPFPWFSDNIGVGLGTGVGVLGGRSPEKVVLQPHLLLFVTII
ncbi:unnamed protein product [Gongylonema pulchrum]|uniref:Chitin-binding type-2 domain-containing protein n=1 Tax=Gongylonema pulchrum TaxID=637853 RepID=A0A183CYX7_9BILA|nr:unnamed protein product [Gongylonema pulchrum]